MTQSNPAELMMHAFERVFAEGDSDAQASFLNAIGQSLWDACRRDKNTYESQLCYIESTLNEHGKRFVKELGGFVGLE